MPKDAAIYRVDAIVKNLTYKMAVNGETVFDGRIPEQHRQTGRMAHLKLAYWLPGKYDNIRLVVKLARDKPCFSKDEIRAIVDKIVADHAERQ